MSLVARRYQASDAARGYGEWLVVETDNFRLEKPVGVRTVANRK